MSDKCLDCQSGVARMQPSERENHAQKASDSSSNYISVIIHTLCVLLSVWFERNKLSARMVRMPRSRSIITRFQLSDRLFALPTHPRYHSLPAKRVQGTLTLWEDMGQKYNDDYIRKKEREEKKLHNKKREKPSCVQTSLMKTTRNPPSSSLQNSEAELAFCGDIILTPRFSSR